MADGWEGRHNESDYLLYIRARRSAIRRRGRASTAARGCVYYIYMLIRKCTHSISYNFGGLCNTSVKVRGNLKVGGSHANCKDTRKSWAQYRESNGIYARTRVNALKLFKLYNLSAKYKKLINGTKLYRGHKLSPERGTLCGWIGIGES